MLQFWTSCAITNRPSTTGQLPTQPFVVVNPGPFTKAQHSILQIHIGSYQGPCFILSFHLTSQSLQKARCPTRCSRRRRNFTIKCALDSEHGQNEMAFPPCHNLPSLTFATNSGPNTHTKSPITSPSFPLPSSRPPSRVQFSTARTNMPRLFGSFVRVSTTNPSNGPSKIRPFLNNYPLNHPRLSLPLLILFNANVAKHTLGQ